MVRRFSSSIPKMWDGQQEVYENETHSSYHPHGFDGAAGCHGRNDKQRPIANHHHHRQWFCTALLPATICICARLLPRVWLRWSVLLWGPVLESWVRRLL